MWHTERYGGHGEKTFHRWNVKLNRIITIKYIYLKFTHTKSMFLHNLSYNGSIFNNKNFLFFEMNWIVKNYKRIEFYKKQKASYKTIWPFQDLKLSSITCKVDGKYSNRQRFCGVKQKYTPSLAKFYKHFFLHCRFKTIIYLL